MVYLDEAFMMFDLHQVSDTAQVIVAFPTLASPIAGEWESIKKLGDTRKAAVLGE